jgi:predicted Zn-dependent protease
MMDMDTMKRFFLSLVLTVPLLAVGACSVNPATGKQSFTAFMSPEKEKEVGETEHPKILEQFNGAYDDPDLGFYIARVGANLARYSELPDLNFTFTILNDEKVNAFALPGGYIYITRGLLAITADEAEMAGVLAHEIGHVTARHTAQRYSAAMATNIGLQVLGVLGSAAGAPTGAGQLASLGAQMALQSYSREQELESDMLGVRYLSRAGYDPSAMTSFFHKLGAHSKLEAAMRGEKDRAQSSNIMSTHPLTSERIVESEKRASEAAVTGRERGKENFVSEIDGLVFGDDPDQGIRRGRVFEHPVLGIRFEVPPDFTMINTPSQLIARGEEGSTILFDMAPDKKVRELGGIRKYLTTVKVNGASFRNVESLSVNGMSAVTGAVQLGNAQQKLDVRLLVVEENRKKYFRFQFRTEPEKTEELALAFRRMTYSFRTLTAKEIAAIKPLRVHFHTVQAGDTVQSLAGQMPMEKFGLEWFELMNDVKRDAPLKAGSRVRIVTQ